jgi:hypothetical protein
MARRKRTPPPPVVIDDSPADPDELLDEAASLMRAELQALGRAQRAAPGGRLTDEDFRRFMALTDRLADLGRASADAFRAELRQARRMSESALEALDEGMDAATREECNVS